MLPPDAFQGAMAERQIELANETARPESRELLAQSNDLLLQSRGSLAGLAVRSTGEFDQATWSLLLIAAQPFADGGDGGLEQTGGGLDAMQSSVRDQPQAMIVGAAHFPHQGEVGRGHGGAL